MDCYITKQIADFCNREPHMCHRCLLQELKYQTGTHSEHTDKEWLECEECGQCYDLKGKELEY